MAKNRKYIKPIDIVGIMMYDSFQIGVSHCLGDIIPGFFLFIGNFFEISINEEPGI